MLFPIKEASEEARQVENAKILEQGQIVSPNCYYMKQTVGNACGTVGLLHCILNARSHLPFLSDSYIEKFFLQTQSMTPEERAVYLEKDDEIEVNHEVAASSGQSHQITTEVDTHFVCFT